MLFQSHEEHLDIDSIFQPTMDDRLKGNSLIILHEDSDTSPNSDGSQLSKPSTADQHLSMLMEQGKAMVVFLQSYVDEQKKETDKQQQHHKLTLKIEIAKALGDMDELKHLHLKLNNSEY